MTEEEYEPLRKNGPNYALESLVSSPLEVREDVRSMMEAIVAAIDGWQRKEDRVIDGRVGVIALYLLGQQQRRIMQRIAAEDVGPRGPHKN